MVRKDYDYPLVLTSVNVLNARVLILSNAHRDLFPPENLTCANLKNLFNMNFYMLVHPVKRIQHIFFRVKTQKQ
jgi:hypothetical protein